MNQNAKDMNTPHELQTLAETDAGKQKLRVMLAELRGYEMSICRDGSVVWNRGMHRASFHDLPNYCEDLNLCEAAVARLSEEQRHAYAIHLAMQFWPLGWQDWRDTLAVSEATALQRTIALILTMQKP